MRHHLIRTLFVVGLVLLVSGVVGWVQASPAAQATVMAQGDPAGLSVEVVGPGTVSVGDTFQITVVANNIPDPGIFGFQFVLNWDNAVFSPVTVTPNPDFSIVAKDALGDSAYEIAASLEGDVPDMAGPITLLTVDVQANAVTDPDASVLSLSNVRLGRRGGIEVPVDQLVDLSVVVVDVTSADIVGNVKVEGRAADNQAGHIVTDGAALSTTTGANGDFSFGSAPFGTYDLTANSAGFLAATCTGVVHDGGLTTLSNVVLLAGDINDDNVIDITDAVAIGAVFGSTTPGETADLNADGEVDILDLILMSVNFGQTSGDNPWVCQ